ncbi:hypothetical protein TrVGV298_006659 [Trichoderma virens]|nr:hypothetical protein TrVGV298_006659 [Trichoderma virens]
MKSFSVYAILLGVTSAVAASYKTGADKDAISWAPLVWTGQVKAGEDNVTLSGTAEEIYNQIIAINPDYDSQLGVKSGREASDTVPHIRGDPINTSSRNCNVFKETYQINVYDGINYLYAIGNGGCTAPAGWGGCIRTTCNNNAAIFLCNDHPTSITVPLGINEYCIRYEYISPLPGSGAIGNWIHHVRGQIFSFDGTWNVIVTDSYCSDPPTKGP